jgi:Circularly permutated YpsA SLOG family
MSAPEGTPMIHVIKVISGGQTGVDEIALETAIECGREVGGWCPPDCRNEAGEISKKFHLQPTPQDASLTTAAVARSQRTEWNVCCSNATLILRPKSSSVDDAGTRRTIEVAELLRRPWKECDPRDEKSLSEIIDWLDSQTPLVKWLNIAGPSRSTLTNQIGQIQQELFLKAARHAVQLICGISDT